MSQLPSVIQGKLISEEHSLCHLVWWERVDALVSGKSTTSKKKVAKRMMKVCKEGAISDALAKLEEKIPSF